VLLALLTSMRSAAAVESPAVSAEMVPAEVLRDPFVPPDIDREPDDISPIVRFSLGELRLVATVNGVRPARALIEDPEGLGFITVVGDTVGAERYRIVSIKSGEIELSSSGSEASSTVIMTLRGGLSGNED
jgi:hypothetical protein